MGTGSTRLSTADVNARLQEESDAMERAAIGSIIENCFSMCAYNFKTGELDSRERDCMDKCVEKWIKYQRWILDGSNHAQQQQQQPQRQPEKPNK